MRCGVTDLGMTLWPPVCDQARMTCEGETVLPRRLEALSATSLTSSRVMRRGSPTMLLPKACFVSARLRYLEYFGGVAHRVGSDVDVLLLAVSDQSVGLEERVAFDLVGGGDDTGALDEGLELHYCISSISLPPVGYTHVVNGEVGNTDRARLLLGKLGHGLPGIDDGNVVVNGAVVLGGEGEELRAALEGHGPVNEVELRQLLILIRQSREAEPRTSR